MLFNSFKSKVFIYTKDIDMRKAHNGLSFLITEEMKLDLLSRSIFLFISKNKRSCKAILWDGTGLILIHKKMENKKFMSFTNLDGVQQINSAELALVLEGTKINIGSP